MRVRLVVSCLAPLCLGLLSGCGIGPIAAPEAASGLSLAGVVHGGRAPISGAHIYLFATGTGGYAGSGVAASSANASVSLLDSTKTGLSDATGAYVLTGTDGSFAITSDYNCTPNQQVYLYSAGGDAGGGSPNSAATLMLALGTCPSDGTFAGHVPFLVVNEVSTIAAAYSIAGWATDPLHISTDAGVGGNTTAANATTGIALAFKDAAMLANPYSGVANSTVGTNGVVPQQEINTLANILASCVNTTGPGSTACTTLLGAAKSAGTTGSNATDTADAAINIAHFPAAATTTLYPLQTATSPYPTDLGTAPTDFTLGVTWPVTNIGSQWVAVDSQGGAWYTASNNAYTSVFKINAGGSAASFTGNGKILVPMGVAIQNGTDNAWIGNLYGNDIVVLDTNGNLVSTYGDGQTTPDGNSLAPAYFTFDSTGNCWIHSNGYLVKMAPSGTSNSSTALSTGNGNGSRGLAFDKNGILWDVAGNALRINTATNAITTYTQAATSVYDTYAVASDASGNTWFAQYYGGLQRISSSGTVIAPTNGFGGLSYWGFAFDGANHGWFPARSGTGPLYAIDGATPNAATSLTYFGPSAGYSTNGLLQSPLSTAVDNAGNVWLANLNDVAVEFIGLGAPVVTPISQAVATGKIATRP